MGIFLILAMSQSVSAWSSTEYLDRVGDYVDFDTANTEYVSVFLRDADISEIIGTDVSVEWTHGSEYVLDGGHWEKKINVITKDVPIYSTINQCNDVDVFEYENVWDSKIGDYKNTTINTTKNVCVTVKDLLNTKDITEEQWIPFDWKTNAYEIRWIAKLKPTFGFRAIDHVPTVNDYVYQEYSWWNTTWENRDCFNITNPRVSAETNITIRISLNMSNYVVHENCSGLRWADENDIAVGFWNSTNCDASGVANTTLWVNVPTVKTDNSSQVCLYHNNSDTTLSVAWSIFKAGIFADDFDDNNVDDWGYGFEPANPGCNALFPVTNGYIYSPDISGRCGTHNINIVDMSEFRMFYRWYTGGSATMWGIATGNDVGYMHRCDENGDYCRVYTYPGATQIGTASFGFSGNTFYDMLWSHDQDGNWYSEQNGNDISFITSTPNTSYQGNFLNFSLNNRYNDGQNDRIYHALLMKWCSNCTVEAQPSETAPAPEESSSLNILFTNNSFTPFKTLFDEGENFFTWWNWSDDSDDSPISDTVGKCNYTVFNGIIEEESDNRSFTLCDIGACDIQNPYSYEYNREKNDTEETGTEDIIVFDICHNNIITNDMNY